MLWLIRMFRCNNWKRFFPSRSHFDRQEFSLLKLLYGGFLCRREKCHFNGMKVITVFCFHLTSIYFHLCAILSRTMSLLVFPQSRAADIVNDLLARQWNKNVNCLPLRRPIPIARVFRFGSSLVASKQAEKSPHYRLEWAQFANNKREKMGKLLIA